MTAADYGVRHILSLAGRMPEDHADAVAVGLVELAALIGLNPRFADALVGEDFELRVNDADLWDVLSTALDGDDVTVDGSPYVSHRRAFGTHGVFSVTLLGLRSVVEPEVPRG